MGLAQRRTGSEPAKCLPNRIQTSTPRSSRPMAKAVACWQWRIRGGGGDDQLRGSLGADRLSSRQGLDRADGGRASRTFAQLSRRGAARATSATERSHRPILPDLTILVRDKATLVSETG